MKPKSTLRPFLFAAGSSLVAISSASAQTWDGGGADTNWSSGLNWSTDVAPVGSASITFAGTTRPTNVNNLTAGITFNAINFTNSTAGEAFSISGNSITLGGNITTTASTGAGITDILDLNLILNGARTITTNTLHNLTISSISESGTGRNLSKAGAGTLTITGSTSFTGTLEMTGGSTVLQGTNTMGVIRVWVGGTSLTFGNGGLGSSTALLSLGSSSGSATLIYTGSDDYSIGRQIQNGASGSGQGIIRNNGAGALIFTNSAFNTGTGASSSRTLSLGGSNGSSVNQIQGVISNQHATHTLAITKLEDASIWKLSGLNSYTGATTVNGGTLLIGRDAPASANGALGNASSEVSLGVANGNTAASLLTDGAFTVARVIRLATNNTTDTGTRVLTLGGNSAHNSEFSGNIILGTNSNAGRGVTLTAASGGQVTFSGVIQNPTSMDATTYTVTKSGSGTVILSNTNTYTGATKISSGTLAVNGSISNSATTVETSGVLTGTGTLGSSLTVKSTGVVNAGTVGSINTTAAVTGATTFEAGSIFSWDLSANGSTGDKLTTGSVTGPGGAIFRILLADGTVANSFFDTTQTNFFADTNIISSVSDLTALFNTVQVYSGLTNLAVDVSARGAFSLTSSGVTWTAIPEPTSALAGLLLGAGLLRRRRK